MGKIRSIHFSRTPSSVGGYASVLTKSLIIYSIMVSTTIFFGQTAKQTFALETNDPKFWSLVDKNATMSTLASGFGFTEGPVWDRSGFLWVSDETHNKIVKIDAKTGRIQLILPIGDPDGNTYDRQHRLIDCASVLRAVIRLSADGHSFETIVDRYQGKRFNSPNDIVLGPDGALYFTDPTSNLPRGQNTELPFKGVYRIAPDGQTRLLVKKPRGAERLGIFS